MNFLEIVQRLARECDVGAPTSVVDQEGENERLVGWAQSAYQDICKKHRNWKFLRSAFTVDTVADTQAYLPTACTDNDALSAAITAADFSHWWTRTFRIYKSSEGVATQRWIPYRSHGYFRDKWLIASPAAAFPSEFTERPRDKAILLGAKPDAVYVLTGEYQRRAPVLALDANEPLFHEEHHEIIVWFAIIRYAGFEEDSGLYDHAEREYKKLLGALERDELPAVGMAGGLV